MSQLLCDNRDCFNNTNSYNSTTNIYITPDDKSKILEWLSPLVPLVRHRGIRAERVEGVGAWLLETKEFKHWHNVSGEDQSNNATLFCDGNPGVGKSYIM